jgi:GAF domain-containing protein
LQDKYNSKKNLNKVKSRYMAESEVLDSIKDIPELVAIKKTLAREQPPSLKDMSDMIMNLSKKLTGSEHCYVAFVDPKNGDSVGISFSHMTGECQMYQELGEARFPIRKDGTYGGLLGYSLDTGKSFYVHDPASHPAAHGLPPGHVPVNQFMSVPVIYEGKIVGQIVVGNPEEDYNNHHLEIANKIARIYAVALKNILY